MGADTGFVLTPEIAARLAVVVVNYGSHDLLERYLAPLSRAVPSMRVVVVDNFSSADEREHIACQSRRHGWTALLLDDNLGFGTGVNRGVEVLTDVDNLVLLNPDATLTPEGLERLVEHLEQHPLNLVAPRVETPDGRLWSAGSDLVLRTGEMRGWRRRPADADPASYQPWLSGACLALTRELWDRAGGFDDDYFLYWEDVDLARRVLAVGGTLRVVSDVTAVHDQGATHRGKESPRAKSGTYYYYNARNRLLFASRHLSPREQRRWRRTAVVAGYRLLLQGGRRQLVHPRRTWIPVARGIRDGLRMAR